MSEEMKKALEEMEARIIATVKQEMNQEVVKTRKYEKKLHNTRLLLKNFRKFKKHSDQADFTAVSLIDDELLEMLDIDFEDKHDELYIKSILRTKERTAKMLNYIQKVLEFNVTYTIGNKTEHNRALTLKLIYVDGMTQSQVADKLGVDERSIRRYIEDGVSDVAPLMFGIDGIKLF